MMDSVEYERAGPVEYFENVQELKSRAGTGELIMEIIEKREERGLLLLLAGKLDTNSSPPTQQKILQVLERGEKKLLLDLAGMDYVNSAGLRVFMMAAKKVKSIGGKLAI